MNTTNTGNRIDTTWTIDPAHTTVGFSVRHMMVANVRGTFHGARGTVRYDAGAPEATTIAADIPTESVQTSEPQRDAHLRSAEFFDAAAHPMITFRSTGARVGAAGVLEVTGDLTIRGITRQATLAVADISGGHKDHTGASRTGASATTRIKRSDFGITYNKVLETGGIAISDEVSLTLDVSLVQRAVS